MSNNCNDLYDEDTRLLTRTSHVRTRRVHTADSLQLSNACILIYCPLDGAGVNTTPGTLENFQGTHI